MKNRKKTKTVYIAFSSLGEYRLHYHYIREDQQLGPMRMFNCSIRDREELLTERVELKLGEELHTQMAFSKEMPLLRFDENGFWAWLHLQKLWWPLRNQKVQLDLDRSSCVRVKFLDLN